MRKLLLFATLLGPLSCSGVSPTPTIPKSIEPCRVLRLAPPPPGKSVKPCSEVVPLDEMDDQRLLPLNSQVCIDIVDTTALAVWIADVEETRLGLESCPLVQLVDE